MDVGVSSIAAMIARSRRWCTGGGIWNRCPWTKVATEREELVNLNPGAWRPRRRDGGIFTLKFTERPFRPRPGILKVGTRREQPLSRLLPLRHRGGAATAAGRGRAGSPSWGRHRAEKRLLLQRIPRTSQFAFEGSRLGCGLSVRACLGSCCTCAQDTRSSKRFCGSCCRIRCIRLDYTRRDRFRL